MISEQSSKIFPINDGAGAKKSGRKKAPFLRLQQSMQIEFEGGGAALAQLQAEESNPSWVQPGGNFFFFPLSTRDKRYSSLSLFIIILTR